MSLAKILLVLGLLCCALLLGAEQPAMAPTFAGPMLWSTPVEAFAISGSEPPSLSSMFVPETEIVVTRIEAFSENGPRLNLGSVTGQPVPCSPQPSVRVGAGSDGYTLQLTNTFLPNSASTYSDSGPLSLTFGAGTTLTLSVLPPQARQAAQCLTKQLNVQVHYKVKIQR
jgi:hypothetical protein